MGQLALSDLEQVMNKGYYLLAEKKAPHLSKRETELFMEINKGFEQEFQDRYDLLKEKMENGTMNLLENEEFIGMTETVEARNVTRLQCIVELAQLRKVTVPELMNQLGLVKYNG